MYQSGATDGFFYDTRHQKTVEAARTIVALMGQLLDLRSVVDLGCGVGTWLSVFQDTGVSDILGYERAEVDEASLVIPPERIIRNFSGSVPTVDRHFDLAVCLEMAEHMPQQHAEQIVECLTTFSDSVLFSAAVPGQGGFGHVNEQWQSYWQERFARFHFKAFDVIRPHVWRTESIPFFYRQNILLYVSEAKLEHDEALRSRLVSYESKIVDIVHPALFGVRSKYIKPRTGAVLSALPSLVVNSIKGRIGGCRKQRG